jgi:hypothetical protein
MLAGWHRFSGIYSMKGTRGRELLASSAGEREREGDGKMQKVITT